MQGLNSENFVLDQYTVCKQLNKADEWALITDELIFCNVRFLCLDIVASEGGNKFRQLKPLVFKNNYACGHQYTTDNQRGWIQTFSQYHQHHPLSMLTPSHPNNESHH